MVSNQVVLPKVSRVEVIDSTGRAFVRYYESDTVGVTIDIQDGGSTIKIFAGIPRYLEGFDA